MKGKIAPGDKIYKISSKTLTEATKPTFSGKELKKIKLNCKISIKKDLPITVFVKPSRTYDSYKNVSVNIKSEIYPETAINQPITKEKIISQFSKTTDTPFEFETIDVDIDDKVRREGIKEVAEEGKIEKISLYVSEILKSTDNRIFIKFDEKYIQSLYYTLLRNTLKIKTYVEYECKNGYIDIMIKGNKEYMNTNIMIELKYIKKSEYSNSKVEEKVREGKEQLMRYELDERIDKENLRRYLVVYV